MGCFDSFENAQVRRWPVLRVRLPWPLISLGPMNFEDHQRKAIAPNYKIMALALEYLTPVGSANAFLNLRNSMP